MQSVRAAVLPVLVSTIGLASVTDLALVAEAHGCEQLERACVRFAADPDVLCRLWQQPRFLQVLAVHCLVAASACGSCFGIAHSGLTYLRESVAKWWRESHGMQAC